MQPPTQPPRAASATSITDGAIRTAMIHPDNLRELLERALPELVGHFGFSRLDD